MVDGTARRGALVAPRLQKGREWIHMENSLAVVVEAGGNLDALSSALEKIKAFQALVQRQLVEGMDYGKIPGCGERLVLLKPGAEKISVLLGLRSNFEIVREIEDFESGFFSYMVRCSLVTGAGEVVTQGFGQCNTRERRFGKGDPFSGANVALKMARKRALVDAALTVGSLSNLFTQDLEDMSEKPEGKATGTRITEEQKRKIYATALQAGIEDAQLRSGVLHYYHAEGVESLSEEQARDLLERIAAMAKAKAAK